MIGERDRNLGWKGAALVTAMSILGGAAVGANYAPYPEKQATPEPRTFLEGYSVGLDPMSSELVVVNEEKEVVNPLGNGGFDNGVQIDVIYHLRGGKVI